MVVVGTAVPDSRERPRHEGWRARVPTFFATTLTILGALCAVAAVSEAAGQRIQPVRQLVNGLLLPAPANLGYAALVAVLAAGVARRKRVAYVFLVVYFALQFVYDPFLLAPLLLLSPPAWASWCLGRSGGSAFSSALAVLLRSRGKSAARTPHGGERIRPLRAASGDRDSLGYFAPRRDKAVVFSPTGKAAVTYRVVNGVGLASGDPVGDVEAWGPAIKAWLRHARSYGWTPAVMGASEQGATAYARAKDARDR